MCMLCISYLVLLYPETSVLCEIPVYIQLTHFRLTLSLRNCANVSRGMYTRDEICHSRCSKGGLCGEYDVYTSCETRVTVFAPVVLRECTDCVIREIGCLNMVCVYTPCDICHRGCSIRVI